MKKLTLLTVAVFVAATLVAQEYPNVLSDPGAVPIVESILGLFGLFVFPLVIIVVVLKMLRKNR